MKMRLKLFIAFWFFGTAIFLFTSRFLAGLSLTGGNHARQDAVLVLAVCAIAGISYLLAVTYSRRLEVLAAQAQHAVRQRVFTPVKTTDSRDEIEALARAVNRLKSQLTEGEDIRNRLVADVSHELRTPIAILRGHLETMTSGAVDPDREHLIPLLDETKRMSRLIQDLQDLNLAEAGKLALDRSWTPFGSMLEEIVTILAIEAEAKSIALHLEGGEDGELYGDIPRLKQVFVNLIGNAVRYTPEGGRIGVRYAYAGGQAVVTIADNGPGIAPESLPYIFKRFYRIENSRSRMSGGTGLGLAIAQQYIEVHAGTIQVESEPGVGTTFTVTLPVYPPNP